MLHPRDGALPAVRTTRTVVRPTPEAHPRRGREWWHGTKNAARLKASIAYGNPCGGVSTCVRRNVRDRAVRAPGRPVSRPNRVRIAWTGLDTRPSAGVLAQRSDLLQDPLVDRLEVDATGARLAEREPVEGIARRQRDRGAEQGNRLLAPALQRQDPPELERRVGVARVALERIAEQGLGGGRSSRRRAMVPPGLVGQVAERVVLGGRSMRRNAASGSLVHERPASSTLSSASQGPMIDSAAITNTTASATRIPQTSGRGRLRLRSPSPAAAGATFGSGAARGCSAQARPRNANAGAPRPANSQNQSPVACAPK